jgi:hypothetical protein
MKTIRSIFSVTFVALAVVACAAGSEPDEGQTVAAESPDFEDVGDLSPQTFVADLGTVTGNRVGFFPNLCQATNEFQTSCNGTSREATFLWTTPSAGTFGFSATGSTIPTAIEVRNLFNTAQVFTCGKGNPAVVSVPNLPAGQKVLIHVEGSTSTCAGSIQLNIKKSGG